MGEKSSQLKLNDAEHHDTGSRSANCRNRALSLPPCKDDECAAETTGLLQAHLSTSDNDYDDDNDIESAAERAVPSTCVDDNEPPAQTLSSFPSVPLTTRQNDSGRRWTSLKRWFTPGSTATPAIRLNELQTRLPSVRTDVQCPCQ